MTDYRHSFENMGHTLDRISAKRRELQAVVEELPRMAYEASSPDGSVAVTADWQGVLTGIRLGASAVNMSVTHVVDNILNAYAQAQQASARKVAEILHIDDPDSVHPLHRSILDRASFQPTVQSAATNDAAAPVGSPAVDPHHGDDDEFDLSSLRT